MVLLRRAPRLSGAVIARSVAREELIPAAAAANPSARETASQKARMAAVLGLLQHDRAADLVAVRAATRAGMNGSLRALSTSVGTAIAAEPRLAARAPPVVVRAVEAVQRRGDDVVEGVHRVDAPDRGASSSMPGKRRAIASAFGISVCRKCTRVDAVEALADRDARRRRGRAARTPPPRRSAIARARSLLAAEPVEQRAAAERDADRVQRRRGRERTDRREHPADLGVVARVIGARQAIRLAAAAAEVRHDAAPADALRGGASARARSATTSCLRARGTARPAAARRRVAPARRASRSRRSRRRACRCARRRSGTSRRRSNAG